MKNPDGPTTRWGTWPRSARRSWRHHPRNEARHDEAEVTGAVRPTSGNGKVGWSSVLPVSGCAVANNDGCERGAVAVKPLLLTSTDHDPSSAPSPSRFHLLPLSSSGIRPCFFVITSICAVSESRANVRIVAWLISGTRVASGAQRNETSITSSESGRLGLSDSVIAMPSGSMMASRIGVLIARLAMSAASPWITEPITRHSTPRLACMLYVLVRSRRNRAGKPSLLRYGDKRQYSAAAGSRRATMPTTDSAACGGYPSGPTALSRTHRGEHGAPSGA